jgi:hypothetical protein
MKTTTTTTTTTSRRAETLARVRQHLHAAGHRQPASMRARLNLADIRQRKDTRARLARTIARQLPPAPPETMPAVYGIDWQAA